MRENIRPLRGRWSWSFVVLQTSGSAGAGESFAGVETGRLCNTRLSRRAPYLPGFRWRHTCEDTAYNVYNDCNGRAVSTSQALTPVYNVLDLTPQGRGDWYASLDYPPNVKAVHR